MLKYIEHKSGAAENGPAWIARVKVSKSGRTVYFNGRALKRIDGGGISGNHFDLESGDEYWVSGIKKRGVNRHWAGSGVIMIEASAVPEYLEVVGRSKIDSSQFRIVRDFPEPDPATFYAHENQELNS
jgi:hypothetical protein